MNVIFRVVLLTFAGVLIYAMSAGIRNNYGIMLHSIIDSSGTSFASVSFVLAVGQLIFGLVQPLFGIMAAKKGNVSVLVSGIALMLVGMVLTPLCKSIAPLILCLGFILPAGTGALSYGIIMGTLTPKIPPRSVSAVSGIVNASSGVGNTALSPVINSLIRTGGLMHGMLVLAVPLSLMLPVSLWMGKKDKKQVRSGENLSPSSSSHLAEDRVNIKAMFQRALKSKTYIYLMLGFFTCGFHMALITNHLPTQIRSFGFSPEAVAYAFSVYGVATIVGSVLSGSLCGKFKMKNVLGFYYGLRPITILLFLVVPKTLPTVTLFTALFGFSGAATVPPVSGIINRVFGAGSIATLYGLVFFVHQIGGFFGAWFAGICFEATKSYTAVWTAAIVFGIAASAVSLAIKETESDR
ncbi:MAG: MFS transporter [Synergistaceae bacterium]|nr:MFS transporter [Synergistaceae bacterium]